MFNWYGLFKFLHVGASIVWVGGVITLVVLNARLAAERDQAAVQLFARHAGFFGRRVFGPAAMVTLLAGIGMAALMRWGMTLWLAWGLVGVFGSIALGGIAGRRAGMALAKLSAARNPDPAELQRARRRVLLLNAANVALLVSTVWAMVYKPTL